MPVVGRLPCLHNVNMHDVGMAQELVTRIYDVRTDITNRPHSNGGKATILFVGAADNLCPDATLLGPKIIVTHHTDISAPRWRSEGIPVEF